MKRILNPLSVRFIQEWVGLKLTCWGPWQDKQVAVIGIQQHHCLTFTQMANTPASLVREGKRNAPNTRGSYLMWSPIKKSTLKWMITTLMVEHKYYKTSKIFSGCVFNPELLFKLSEVQFRPCPVFWSKYTTKITTDAGAGSLPTNPTHFPSSLQSFQFLDNTHLLSVSVDFHALDIPCKTSYACVILNRRLT